MREMKDSGVEWIGEIPVDWNITKMKYIGQYINGYAFKPDDWSSQGKPIIRIQDLTGSNSSPNFYNGILPDKYLIKSDDILVSWAATLDVFIWKREEGWLNQHIFKAIPNCEMIDKNFFFWLVKVAMENMNHDNKHGIVMQHVTLAVFNNFSIPIPTKRIQKHIANYLDIKCAQIDTVTTKQQKIIEKLKAYKASFINEVINGIDGIKCHLGYIGIMKNGLNFSNTLVGEKFKFLGVGDFQDNFILDKFEMFSDIITTDEISEDYMLAEKDIIFVRSNGSKELVGRAVMVKNIDFPLTYSGFCIRFRNIRSDIIDNSYLLYFFRSLDFRKQLEKYSQGSNINNVNQELLSQIDFKFPDIELQRKSVCILDDKCKKIDTAIKNKENLVDKLTAYKKSLIYEVVTGKREV